MKGSDLRWMVTVSGGGEQSHLASEGAGQRRSIVRISATAGRQQPGEPLNV